VGVVHQTLSKTKVSVFTARGFLQGSILNKRRIGGFYMPFNPNTSPLDEYLEYLYVTGQLDTPDEEEGNEDD
jgi:hypothetical protein